MDQRDQRFSHYVNVSSGSTTCYLYYFLRFQSEPMFMDLSGLSRVSVFSTNCFTRSFVFLERGMFMYQTFFAAFYRSVQLTVLAIPFLCFQNEECIRLCICRFCRRLTVGSTKCSTPFCVFRTRNVHLLVVIQVYPPVRQTFNVES